MQIYGNSEVAVYFSNEQALWLKICHWNENDIPLDNLFSWAESCWNTWNRTRTQWREVLVCCEMMDATSAVSRCSSWQEIFLPSRCALANTTIVPFIVRHPPPHDWGNSQPKAHRTSLEKGNGVSMVKSSLKSYSSFSTLSLCKTWAKEIVKFFTGNVFVK